MTVTAPFAKLFVYPKVVAPGNIEKTTRNIFLGDLIFMHWHPARGWRIQEQQAAAGVSGPPMDFQPG